MEEDFGSFMSCLRHPQKIVGSAWLRKLGIVGIPAGCGHSPKDGAGASGVSDQIRNKDGLRDCRVLLGTSGDPWDFSVLLSVFAHQALGTDLTHPRGFRALQFTFLKESRGSFESSSCFP